MMEDKCEIMGFLQYRREAVRVAHAADRAAWEKMNGPFVALFNSVRGDKKWAAYAPVYGPGYRAIRRPSWAINGESE